MKDAIRFILISRPVLSLILVFSLLIFVTSFVIFFEEQGEGISFVDALFTGSSASTVTGLTVVNTIDLSFLSQLTILGAIEIGGFLAIGGGAFIVLAAGKIASSRQGKISAASLTLIGVGWDRFWDLLRFIAIFSFVVQALSALVLFFRFKEIMEAPEALWYAVFHAASSFYGAGFFLFQDNLYSFRDDPIVLSIIMVNIILGGIGILIILTLKERLFALPREILFTLSRKTGLFRFDIEKRRKFYEWPLHVKLVIPTTLILLLLGFLVFWGLESRNVLGGMPWHEGVLASLFQSVSARAAGFSTVDMGAITPATQFFFGFLMFIGAGSVSASGGIKVTTFAIIVLVLWARYKRRERVTVGGLAISQKTITKANGVLLLSLATVFVFIFCILILETADFGDIVFDAISAFGTVGFSSGITETLSTPSKVLMSILMLMGRIGPLALTYLFGRDIIEDKSSYRLRETEVEVG